MKKFLLMLFALSVFGLCGAEIKWKTDMAEAAAAAAKEKKPIIILFTGSDWCPPCMRMEKTTWKDQKVIKEISDRYIPLLVDMPRRRQLSQEQQKKNQQLAAKYKLRYVPTIIVTDASGKELERTGFNSPDAFLKFLKKF